MDRAAGNGFLYREPGQAVLWAAPREVLAAALPLTKVALDTDAMNLPRPFGPYMLLRRLAVGGMAEVYVAKARGIGGFEKLVAIKVIHPRFSEDEHFVTMLVEEAKLAVLLNHINVAQIFDLGCIDDTYFIVMEFIEGADSYRLQRRASDMRKRLPFDVAAFITAEVCNGLDYAHRKRDTQGRPLSIVHRDISPQNILISFAGEVKIVDFGIAKAAQRTGQTEVGVIKGKYYYMSPEQAWADPMDHRSDIFSTGVLIYELLTGAMLYKEDNLPSLLDNVRKADIKPPSSRRADIPADLDEIVMRAVAKKPEDRYQSAHDFGQALTHFLYGNNPSFTGGRLARLMSEVFSTELGDATGTVRLPSGESVLTSLTTDGGRASTTGSHIAVMRPNEYRPDPTKSVIFELEQEEQEDFTRQDIPPYRRLKALAKDGARGQRSTPSPPRGRRPEVATNLVGLDSSPSGAAGPVTNSEDEEDMTIIQSRHTTPEDEWEDPTAVMEAMKPPAEGPLSDRGLSERGLMPNTSGPARESSTSDAPIEDATVVDNTGEMADRVREMLAEQRRLKRAPRPRSAPPPPPRASAPPPPVPAAVARLRPSVRPGPRSVPPPPPRRTEQSASVRPPPAPVIALGQPIPSPRVGPLTLPPAPGPPPPGSQRQVPTGSYAAMNKPELLRWIYVAAGGALLFVVLVVALVVAAFSEDSLPPAVAVVSVPPGAEVRLDGKTLAAVTPIEALEDLEVLEVGDVHALEVRLEGYEVWTQSFTVVEGPQPQTAVLIPLPLRATLTVRTEPPGCQVWVDQVLHGPAPQELPNLIVGHSLEVRASLTGRAPVTQTVTITAQDLSPSVLITLAESPPDE